MSTVGTDKGRCWVGKSDRGYDLKSAGYGRLTPPYMIFPAAADLLSSAPDRASPLTAAHLPPIGVELHPMGGSARPHEPRSVGPYDPDSC
jgi:hypothetical protein